MNREIKFRAWDKTQKKIKEVWLNKTIDRFGITGENVFDNNDYVVMQFTGYKDWKGKDVYEGDIIKSINGQIEYAEVEFNNAAFWLKSFDLMYGEHHREIYHWPANRIALEVIGNIYENPELLK